MAAYVSEQESAQLNHALIEAQNAAELYKSEGMALFSGDGWVPEAAGENEYTYVIYIGEENHPESYYLKADIALNENEAGIYESGQIKAYPANTSNDPEPLFALDIGKYTSK